MYVYRDVSANTSLSVGAISTGLRLGTLVHTTEGRDSLDWLQGGSAKAGSPASADALIKRDGLTYWLSQRGRYAYHAGDSELVIPARPGVSSRILRDGKLSEATMGVELERYGSEIVTDEQIDALAQLIVFKSPLYHWRWPYLVVGHYDVAVPTGRRSDPVNFDWGAFAGRLWYWADHHGIPGTT